MVKGRGRILRCRYYQSARWIDDLVDPGPELCVGGAIRIDCPDGVAEVSGAEKVAARVPGFVGIGPPTETLAIRKLGCERISTAESWCAKVV